MEGQLGWLERSKRLEAGSNREQISAPHVLALTEAEVSSASVGGKGTPSHSRPLLHLRSSQSLLGAQ